MIGRTFITPLRASAVASLAQKDKSAQKSTGFNLAQKFVGESAETSSRASSTPGDAQDVARGCVFYVELVIWPDGTNFGGCAMLVNQAQQGHYPLNKTRA